MIGRTAEPNVAAGVTPVLHPQPHVQSQPSQVAQPPSQPPRTRQTRSIVSRAQRAWDARPGRRKRRSPAQQSVAVALTYDSNDYRDRLIAEGFALLLSWAVWCLNAYFTALGLNDMVGMPWLIGLGIHLGISKIEQYLWKGGIDFATLLLAVPCALFDIGTSLRGLLKAIEEYAPILLGKEPAKLPISLLEWGKPLLDTDLPVWWPQAVAVALIACGIALAPEYLKKRFWVRFKTLWMNPPQPTASAA